MIAVSVVQLHLFASNSSIRFRCGTLNVSQPYGPPRPVTGIALLLLCFYFYFNPSRCTLVDSPSNRNEYRESSCGFKRGRCIKQTNSLPSVSRLSRIFAIFGVSQSHGHPWPVTGIAVNFLLNTRAQNSSRTPRKINNQIIVSHQNCKKLGTGDFCILGCVFISCDSIYQRFREIYRTFFYTEYYLSIQ
jgi:hypothetical protein